MPKKNIGIHKGAEFILSTKIVDDLPYNVDIVDEDCKIVYLNKLMRKKFGIGAIGKKCYELYKVDKKQCVNCPLRKPIKVGEVKTAEVPGMVGGKIFSVTHKGIKIGDKKYILEVFEDITERKNDHDKLISKDYLLSESQKVANLGSYVLDIATGKWESSAVLDSIFGIDKNYDRSIKGWVKIIHPDYKEMMLSYLKDYVIGQKKQFDKEYKIIGVKDKKEYWVHGLGKLDFNKKGNVIRMIGTIQDITERKKTEEELVQYKIIIEQSTQEIAFADFSGHIIFVNNAWAKNHGYTKKELIGKHLSIFHPKTEFKKIEEFNKILIKKGKNSGEMVHQRKDGSIYNTLMNNFVLNIGGKPKYLIADAIDVTERKVVEEKNKRLSDIIEKTFEPIALIDLGKTNILNYVNPAWEKMFGYTKEEVVGKKAGLIIEAIKKQPAMKKKMFESIRKGKIFSGEMIWKRKNDQLVNVEVFSVPIRDEKGKIINWFNTTRDITERKKAEERLHNLNLQLQAISECNEALVRADDEQTLLDDICRIVCEKAGYQMAWVGFALQDKLKTVKVMAHNGKVGDYLEKSKITWSNTSRGHGPTGMAIRTGKTYVNQDFEKDSKVLLWRAQARKYGYRSSIALPLLGEDKKAFGAFNIYSVEPNAFTPRAIQLLTEFSNDLAFGILALHTRFERKQVEEALRKSERRYRRLFETAKDSILILNAHNGKIVDANPFIQESLGYSLKEMIGKEIWQISPFRNIVANKKKFLKLKKAKYVHYENLPLETKTGELRHVEFVSNVYGVNGEQVVQCNIRDITERYNASQALLESEEKNRLLYETSADAIMTLEPPSWKFTSGNQAIVKMFGIKNKEEFTKISPWQVSPEYQPDGQLSSVKAKKMIMKAVKEGSNYFEWTHKKLHGENFFATVLLNRLKFKGKFILQARVQDISEAKLAQNALFASEEKYRTLTESSPDCIKLFDLDGHLLYMNKGGLKEHHLESLEDALKQDWSANDSIDEEYHKDFSKALEKAKKGKTTTLEIKHNPKFSDRGSCLESVVPVKNSAGRVTGVFAISHDITDIKKAEEKLLDSQQKLNATLNSMGDGLFVLDKEGNILMFNHTASIISGFSFKEVFGSHYNKFIKFILESTNLPNDNFIKNCLEEGKEVNFFNHTLLIKKNKTKMAVSTNASPLKDKDGNVVGAVVIFRDVSREREVDAMKTEFVSLASHQLKTPLTGIKWFTELLLQEKNGGLTGTQKDYIQRVSDSNGRLIQLVNDLLDVSHIDTGKKFNVVKKPVDIVGIVNKVVHDKINLINDKKITFIKCVGAPEKLELPIDEGKIRQVFDNLINNAIKYSKIGGTVELGCIEKTDNKIIIHIRDNGIGIPKHQQKRVFEKFFRGDNAITTQTDGTGLGLYIAKAMVEAHGGEMWFDSKEGKGSTFYFSLPLLR